MAINISVADSVTCTDLCTFIYQSMEIWHVTLTAFTYDSISMSETGPYIYGNPALMPQNYTQRYEDVVTISESVTTKMVWRVLVYENVSVTETKSQDDEGEPTVKAILGFHTYLEEPTDQATVTDAVENIELIRGGWRDISEEDDTWNDV